MCTVQKIAFRLRNMGNIVVGNILGVIQEIVSKEAAWATHGVGEGEMCNCEFATH
jgi:hypothetical protein